MLPFQKFMKQKKIGVVGYEDDDFKEIKPSKNNTKLEANIEYFED